MVKLNEWHTCFLCIAFFRKHTFLLVRNKNTTTWYSCFIYGVESAVYHPFFFVIKVRLTFKSRTNRNWSIYTVCTLPRSKMVFGRPEQTNKWYEWNVMYNNTYDARREELTCLVALRMFYSVAWYCLQKNLNNVFGDIMCTKNSLFLKYIARRVNILWRFEPLGKPFCV